MAPLLVGNGQRIQNGLRADRLPEIVFHASLIKLLLGYERGAQRSNLDRQVHAPAERVASLRPQ
jgi:hypothetical protein